MNKFFGKVAGVGDSECYRREAIASRSLRALTCYAGCACYFSGVFSKPASRPNRVREIRSRFEPAAITYLLN